METSLPPGSVFNHGPAEAGVLWTWYSRQAGFWAPAVGTPEEVTAALTPVVTGALGRVTQMACAFRHAGMRTPEVHTSMRLFAGEVLPALRDVAKPGSAAAPAPWES